MGEEDHLPELEQATRAIVVRFNEAFNRHDSEALAELLAEDTIFEDTSPAPDGRRVEGKKARPRLLESMVRTQS